MTFHTDILKQETNRIRNIEGKRNYLQALHNTEETVLVILMKRKLKEIRDKEENKQRWK